MSVQMKFGKKSPLKWPLEGCQWNWQGVLEILPLVLQTTNNYQQTTEIISW